MKLWTNQHEEITQLLSQLSFQFKVRNLIRRLRYELLTLVLFCVSGPCKTHWWARQSKDAEGSISNLLHDCPQDSFEWKQLAREETKYFRSLNYITKQGQIPAAGFGATLDANMKTFLTEAAVVSFCCFFPFALCNISSLSIKILNVEKTKTQNTAVTKTLTDVVGE